MNEDVYNIHTYNPFPEYARNDMYVYNLTRRSRYQNILSKLCNVAVGESSISF